MSGSYNATAAPIGCTRVHASATGLAHCVSRSNVDSSRVPPPADDAPAGRVLPDPMRRRREQVRSALTGAGALGEMVTP